MNLKIIFYWAVLFFVLAGPFLSSSSAVETEIKGPVEIEADQLAYDKEEDTYRATGNVIITFTDGFLVADSVVYNKTTEDAFAEGDVYILSKGDTLEGDRVRFNLGTKTGIAYNGKVFLAENHFYLNGDEIEKKGEATYHIKNATATTCDGDKPAWRFTGKELDVTLEGYGTIKHGTFQVKNQPILYTPYLIFPAKTKRQSGFLFPMASYSKDLNGMDVEVPFFWAISDSTDATFYQRYIEKRGWKEGMEFRYFLSKDSFGTFYADYLNDSKEIRETQDSLSRDWTGNQRRWSYYLNHESHFSPGFYLRTDIAKVSDHFYFRDFSAYNYYLENYSPTGQNKFQRVSFLADKSLATLDSTARLVKDWQLYNLTVLGRYTDNLAAQTNDTTLQSYPLVSFTGVQQPIMGTRLNYTLSSSYQYAYRNEGEKGHVADINPVFSLPLNFGDYLQFTPQVGLRETAWETRGGIENHNATREVYTISAYFASEVHRIFPVEIGSVDKIRHGIKPEITYSYIPNNYFGPLPDFVAAVPETNLVTYSLTNTLIAKLKEKSAFRYLEFLRFKVTQSYSILEARSSKPEEEKRPFSPVDLELDFLPAQYFSYRAQSTFDPNDGEWKRINYDIGLNDTRGDSISLGYRYTQDLVEEINLYLKATVNKALDVKYVLRKNRLDNKNLESTYALDYHKQCWSVELSYSDLDDDKRVMVVFSLYGLGKVGSIEAKPAQMAGTSR
ncbi:MAG: LPS-assembly protein LptD [Syntrophales bacterium]